jgi:hypothetical protein
MLNRPEEAAFHCETSDKDNLWAVETPVPSATDAPLEGEGEAAAELQASGWVEWVDRCLPGEGSLLCPPRLPAALIAHAARHRCARGSRPSPRASPRARLAPLR